MKALRFLLLGALLTGLLGFNGWADDQFQTGLHFSPFFPQGEFRDQIEGMGWGGDMNFSYRLPHSPLSIGVSGAFFVYGVDSRWEPLSIFVPDVLVKVTTTNSLINGLFFLRFQSQKGSLRPYVDGLVGVQHLTTDTRVRINDHDSDSDISSNHWNDTAFCYGAGGGVMIDVFRRSYAQNRAFALAIDAGFQYIKGGFAEYLTEGSIEITEDEIIYYLSETHTDNITARIGISFSF